MAMGRVRGWSLLTCRADGHDGPDARRTGSGTIESRRDLGDRRRSARQAAGGERARPAHRHRRAGQRGRDHHDNDRAHLVFLDGSSLTVGPNARLTIDKFVYDPNSKTGELAVTASQGVLRLVGGKISKTNPITINTPSGTIGIRGGIGIFGIGSGKTTAAFLFGNSMTVTGQGQTQTMTRAEFVGDRQHRRVSQPAEPAAARRPQRSHRFTRAREQQFGQRWQRRRRRQCRPEGTELGLFGQQFRPVACREALRTAGNPPNTSNNAVTTAVSNTGGASNPANGGATV